MTAKQRKYLKGVVEGKTKKQAALDAGYAESTAITASQNIEPFGGLKSQIDIAFEEKGLSLGDLIDSLKEGLDAKQPSPHWYDKNWMPDHNIRLKFLIIALKLWKLI